MKKLLVLFILFTTNSIHAYTYSGMYLCGKLLTMDKEDNPYAKIHVISWFEGYSTGRNFETYTVLDDFNRDSIYYAMIKYCKENPLKDTVDGADSIYSKL